MVDLDGQVDLLEFLKQGHFFTRASLLFSGQPDTRRTFH